MSVGYVAVYTTTGSGGGGGGGEAAAARPAPRPRPRTSPPTATPPVRGPSRHGATGDTNPSGVDGNQAAQLANGDYLEYSNVNFGTTGSTQFDARWLPEPPAA